MSKTVHLVRHGETYNPTGILYGRLPDFHLSHTGQTQAKLVAEWLQGRPIHYLGVSPMERAQETAQPIADITGISINTDLELIEGSSFFEGKRVAFGDGALSRPWYWWKLRNPFKPSWGEPYQDIAQRMLHALDTALAHIEEGQEAVLVSHQLPIWITRLYLSKKKLWHNPAKRQCGLASVTSLAYDNHHIETIKYHEPAGTSDPRITGA